MPFSVRFLRLGLPGWIVVGAVLGIGAGVFFGERTAVLQPVGRGYVMLLEAVVYPYIICSLLHGLGRLTPSMALKLLKRSKLFYLAAWGLTLAAAWLFSQALPHVPAPDAINGDHLHQNTDGLLGIILPSNIFLDLSQNHVPAVVVLAILFGVALQSLPNKDGFMNTLDLIKKAGVRIWGWIVYLAPPAVFAMFAETAGTIRIEALDIMLLYLGLFMIGSFLLAFWILPGIIASLVPESYHEIMHDLRGAFLLSMVTTLSVVALPFIQKAASKLAQGSGIEAETPDGNRDEIISTCLAVNYPLGQLGNFMVYFFMLFAAVSFGVQLDGFDKTALPFMTLLSCVGSPTSTVNAVDFLGGWLGLHGKALPLYIETMVVTRYGQVALSVAGFAFLTILMTQNYFGKLRIRAGKLMAHVGLSVAALVLLTIAGNALGPGTASSPSARYAAFELQPSTVQGIKAEVCRSQAECPPPEEGAEHDKSVFDRVQRTGVLRVGFIPDALPFCYFNDKNQLVGYDTACAYDLARSMGVDLKFIPFEIKEFEKSLESGVFDIAMTGLYITPERLRRAEVSTPYYQSPLALIVPSETAHAFTRMADIEKMQELAVVSFNDPVLQQLIRTAFPFAEPRIIPDYAHLAEHPDASAAIWSFCQARSFSTRDSRFTAVKPHGLNMVVVFGYYLPIDSVQMQRYVNHWIELRTMDGTLGRYATYWLEGVSPEDEAPRWSIMRDVLHWGDQQGEPGPHSS